MRRVLTLLVLLSLAFAPAPFPRPERKRAADDGLLQGTYVLTGYRRGDRNELARGSMKIRIVADRFSFLSPGRNGDFIPSEPFEMKLATKSSPKRFDVNRLSGKHLYAMTGIYKVEGKKVTIAFVSAYSDINGPPTAAERPASFDHLPPGAVLLTMDRE